MQTFLFASAHGESAWTMLDRCMSKIDNIPATANLGFLYVTDRLADDLKLLLRGLKTKTPDVHWVGTIGIGLCTTAKEYYDEPAMAIMIGSFPPKSFRIVPSLIDDLANLPEELAHWWQAQEYCFALLHADPTSPMTGKALERLTDQAYSSFINGGLTSSNSHKFQIADEIVSGGLSGVLFNEQVNLVTDHTQGCTPVGPVHELTEYRRNIVSRLDNRPALEVMKEDIGEVLSRDLKQIGGYVFAALPIRGLDTGDYLVRNLVGLDEKESLIAIGDYLDGQNQLMFCRRDGNTAREDMQKMLERIHARVGNQKIRGGIYISCLGRGRYQFGENSEELKMIEEILGDFPLVGFFANGEIYNGRLYGYTGVLTLFL